jgi:DNA-binding NarL/FixJ family response regulator
VVDDHETVRMGVRIILAREPQFEVCGEACNGREAIDKVKELHPDAVILDVSMPIMNGLEAALEIRRIAPSAKIIMFSMHDSPQMMAMSREAGADAFVLKSAPGQELVQTVRNLLAA